MADREVTTFEQFWDFYVSAHKKKGTRILHFIGLTAAGACIAGGLLTKRRWLLLVAPVAGYGPAWFSHFFIEKNMPASFDYPLWSLKSDLRMWWLTLTGQMQAEVDRVVRAEGEGDGRAERDAVETAEAEQAPAGPASSQAVN
jgi:hypothetical protein